MDTKKIGKFIASNRKSKGLTQEQLGEKLGVSNKTISRWENGNYMPDLSLLEPLSNALGITLNELLAGEKIEKEDICEYTEKNLISALGYTSKKINNERRKISFLIIGIGILFILYAFTACGTEDIRAFVYSTIGTILITIGAFRELKFNGKSDSRFNSLLKRLLASGLLFIFLLTGLHIVDYAGVTSYKRPPIYRYMTEKVKTETDITIYHALPFNVYRINAGTPNEYYIIDSKKTYTLDTLPISPFNREISGIDNLLECKSDYVGNNSNTGMLINHLPLSEYGYVFEIDSENAGLVIDYHATDWYANDNLYVEKSLIYNSVSIFALIDNVSYIQYNFSGSSYKITRDELIKNYPDYDKLFGGGQLNKDNFNKYVEKKMNDTRFVESVFDVFNLTKQSH